MARKKSPPRWQLKGHVLTACSCDWGCPCNFDAPPTYGHCDGGYLWAVKEGHFEGTRLDDITVVQVMKFPEAIHKGNGTARWVVDAKADAAQRKALATLQAGGGIGLPFDIWARVVKTWLPTLYAPVEVKLDGIRSRAKVGRGKIYDLSLSPIKNPVTGDPEDLTLVKGTGFTSKETLLGRTLKAKFETEGFAFDTSGKYGEFAAFDYKGP